MFQGSPLGAIRQSSMYDHQVWLPGGIGILEPSGKELATLRNEMVWELE